MTLLSKINLIKRLLESRKSRDAYVYEHVRNGIPFQIRALRKDREWSQSDLADAAKTSRTVITRIEDPNYGKLTLKTLFAVASAFDVALLVKFVPFSRLLTEYQDVSSAALSVPGIAKESRNLKRWANTTKYSATTTSPTALAGQMELAFTETKTPEVFGNRSTHLFDQNVQVTGKPNNVISLKTKRPLRQRKIKKPVVYRRSRMIRSERIAS